MSEKERIKDMILLLVQDKANIDRLEIIKYINSKIGKDKSASIDKYLKEMVQDLILDNSNARGKYKIFSNIQDFSEKQTKIE